MKKLKKFFLPAIIVMAGIGAAFATNIAKNSQSTVEGYYFDNTSGQCVNMQIECSPVQGTTCTWKDANNIEHNLRLLNGTSCPMQLAKP